MIGGRTRSKNLHFASDSRRRAPWRLIAVVVTLVAVVFVAGLVKAAAATPPVLSAKPALPSHETFPGSPPQPAWPSAGEAAAEVEGLAPIGSSGPEQPVPIASLAKVMTAYVVLKDHPLTTGQSGFTATVGSTAVTDYEQRAAAAQSVVAVKEGETLNETQLLEGLLVPSGNNFATLLADYDAGSVPAFVAKMQATAVQLRMTHTTYTDPSGLASSTVSTATDQLILAAQAMSIPALAKTVGLTSVTLPVAGQLPNFLKTIGTEGSVGIKTGSDSSAGGCLMFANNETTGGHTYTILGVVLGQDKGDQSTAKLIASVQQAADALVHSIVTAVSVQTIVPAGTVAAVVTNADGRKVSASTTTPLIRLGYGGMTVPLSVSLYPVGRTLHQDQTVAQVAVPGGDATTAVAVSSMPGVSFTWKLTHDY